VWRHWDLVSCGTASCRLWDSYVLGSQSHFFVPWSAKQSSCYMTLSPLDEMIWWKDATPHADYLQFSSFHSITVGKENTCWLLPHQGAIQNIKRINIFHDAAVIKDVRFFRLLAFRIVSDTPWLQDGLRLQIPLG